MEQLGNRSAFSFLTSSYDMISQRIYNCLEPLLGRTVSLKHNGKVNNTKARHENTHTLWLLSPSRLAVVTKHVPSSRDDDKRIRSQGKVSSSFTKTTSPTLDRQNTGGQFLE